jgi:hypothetical protein
MLMIALIVVVFAALAAYYVFGVGVPSNAPGAPSATNVPASAAPASAPAAPRYP